MSGGDQRSHERGHLRNDVLGRGAARNQRPNPMHWQILHGPSFILMKSMKILFATLAALLLGGSSLFGQSYYEYKFLFSGTAYRADATGNIVGSPITDQTLLQSQAQRLNVSDPSTISLVYHVDGGPP